MSHWDAGGDSGGEPVCDVAQCPVSDVPLKFKVYEEPNYKQHACCISTENEGTWDWSEDVAGRCGVEFPGAYDVSAVDCQPIATGEIDETCLDTIIDGKVVQGCRRPDGNCGHLTPGWGCHRVYRYYWEVDDEHGGLPNPFNCTGAGGRCTRSSQCCAHPNYGRVCWPENFWGDTEDAGVSDEDGGLPPGYCNYAEYVVDQGPTPYPE